MLDFQLISTKNGRVPSREDWTSVADELDKALSTIGFAYVINHDIDQVKVSENGKQDSIVCILMTYYFEQIANAFERSKYFFELPSEVKQKYSKDLTKSHHGYVQPGQEM